MTGGAGSELDWSVEREGSDYLVHCTREVAGCTPG